MLMMKLIPTVFFPN